MARSTSARAAGSTKAANGGASGIQSVARAMRILELFEENRPALTTTEVAELTGLNRATAYRFCQTLLNLGYLEEVSPRTFRPGLKAVSLAKAALSSHSLPELALPQLRELHDQTGETVNMVLRDGPDVVYVSRLLSDNLLALRLFVGSRLPAYAASLGRAILAYLPEEEVNELLDETELRPFTEHTIVDRRRLREEFVRIRESGYALNEQGLVLGIYGVAAPIFGVSGRPVAAVNISLTRPPEPGELTDVLAPQVVRTAEAISALAIELAVDVSERLLFTAT